MLHSLIYFATNLGDSALTGPLALGLAVYLWVLRQKGAALAVAVALALAAGGIAAGKIIFYSRCEPGALLLDLRSPSGHSALSLVAYGMIAAFVSQSFTGWRRIIPYLVAVPLIVLIAVSRVLLGYHTSGDAVAGLIIGLVACLLAWRLEMQGATVRCRWAPFTIIAAVILSLLYGIHFSAEEILTLIADYVRSYVRSC